MSLDNTTSMRSYILHTYTHIYGTREIMEDFLKPQDTFRDFNRLLGKITLQCEDMIYRIAQIQIYLGIIKLDVREYFEKPREHILFLPLIFESNFIPNN